MRDKDDKLLFSRVDSTVDAGTVYVEVLRAALTPALGEEVTSKMDIMRDVDVRHVTYSVVLKERDNDTSPFTPTKQCISGFHKLSRSGAQIQSYDKDADTKIRQLLDHYMDNHPPESTLVVLVSGDRDFGDVINRAQWDKFDMVVIHSTDAEVNSTLKTLVQPKCVMPVWNLIVQKARIAGGTPGAAVGMADHAVHTSSGPRPGAAGGSKRVASPEEAVVSLAAEHYLKLTSSKGVYDVLSALHFRLAPTPMSLAKGANGERTAMYIGATYEGDGPVADALPNHRIKSAIEGYLDSIVEASVEIQGMSKDSFRGDRESFNMANKACVALYLDKEPDPLQPNTLFIEGPKSILSPKPRVEDYCKRVAGVPDVKTFHNPLDQEGLEDGFVRIRVTLTSVDKGFSELKRVCLAYEKDNVKFSDGQAEAAAPKLDPIKKNWVFAVVEKKTIAADYTTIKSHCKDVVRIPMFQVEVSDQDQEWAQPGFGIARCKPDCPGDVSSGAAAAAAAAAVDKCLAASAYGIRFFRDAASVPTKALQTASDDVSVKVNLAYHKRDADAAERIKKHLISKARITATIPIQPSLMAITRAGLPILKAEVLDCGIKKEDFYFRGEAPDLQQGQPSKPYCKAAPGEIIIKGSRDAVTQAKAVLDKRLKLLSPDKPVAGRHHSTAGVMITRVDVPKAFETNKNFSTGVRHALRAFFGQLAMDNEDDAKSVNCSLASSHEDDEEEQALESPIVWAVDNQPKVKISITSLVPDDAEAAREQEERVDKAVAVANKYIEDFKETFLEQSDFPGFSKFADKKFLTSVHKTFDVFVFYNSSNAVSQGGPQQSGDYSVTLCAVVESKAFSRYEKVKDFCVTNLNVPVHTVRRCEDQLAASPGTTIYSIILNRSLPTHTIGGYKKKLLSFKAQGSGIVGFYKTLSEYHSQQQAQSGSGGDGRLVVYGPEEAVDEAVHFIEDEAKGCAPATHVFCAKDKRIAWVLANPVNEIKRNKFIADVKKACQVKGLSLKNVSAVSGSGPGGELIKIVGQASSMDAVVELAKTEVEKLAVSMKSMPVELSQHEYAFVTTVNRGIKKRLGDKHGVVISSKPLATKVVGRTNTNKILATARLGSVAIEVHEGDLLDSGTDAIVNPANGRLAHGAGAAAAIRKAAGGDEFDQLCRTTLQALVNARSPKVGADGVLKDGEALKSGPCKLSAKGITAVVHAVGPRYMTGSQVEVGSFLSAVRAAFVEAANAGCKTISLPLMGAGVFGWSPDDSANIILQALSQVVAQYGNSCSITHVVLVDFLPAHAAAFRDALLSYVASSTGPGTRDVHRPRVVVAPEFKWYWDKSMDGDTSCKWIPYDYDQVLHIESAISRGSLPIEITGDVAGKFSDSIWKPDGALAPVYAVSKEAFKGKDGIMYDFRQVNTCIHSKYVRAVKREPFKTGDVMFGYSPQASNTAATGNLCDFTSRFIHTYFDFVF
jgi:O-acetyl-ADP-ribose deacetylase (regulator of RNase III)